MQAPTNKRVNMLDLLAQMKASKTSPEATSKQKSLTPEQQQEKEAKKAYYHAQAKAREEKIDAKIQTALQAQTEMQWPELQGTEKQVNWGLTIRYRLLNITKSQRQKLEKSLGSEKVQAIISVLLKTKNTAAWWVEHWEIRSLQKLIEQIETSEPTFVFSVAFEELKQ